MRRLTPFPRHDKSIENRLRIAVEASGEKRRALAIRAGMDPGSLSAFFNGGGLRASTAEKLAGALGLKMELVKEDPAKPG